MYKDKDKQREASRERVRRYRAKRRGVAKGVTVSSTGGWLYLIRCTLFAYYKIGICKNTPKDRLKTLQTGCPFPLNLVKSIECRDIHGAESYLHSYFSQWRQGGEWFLFDSKTLKEVEAKMDHMALFYRITEVA